MAADVKQIGNLVQEKSEFVRALFGEMDKVIVGQRYMLERMLIGLLANGDLLPADLIGTQIYRQSDGQFYTRKGPIFANIILADEINRAPAKVQSALLEAMQERQVSIGEETFPVPSPFLVLATQNPIEQEGTYPLPEAQLDRFMLKIRIDYPSKGEELKILDRMATTNTNFDIKAVISPEQISDVRSVVDEIYIDEKIKDYIVNAMGRRQEQRFILRLQQKHTHLSSREATLLLRM